MKKRQFSLWKKNVKKGILLFGIGFYIAGVGSSAVLAAEQTGTCAGHPVFDNHFVGVEIDDNSQNMISRRGGSFSTKYDPRQTGMVTKIEDQGNYNTCWAFSTIAAIECNIIKKGYADSSLNLSENHLAYFFYKRQTDPLGYTKGDVNMNVHGTWDQNGGTLQGTALSLTTWSGVVNETVPEDDGQGAYKPIEPLPATDCYKSDYKVKNVYFYNYNVDTIKQAITDHGAVASGIFMDKLYWNLTTGAYYCPKEQGNHAVAIVGWDDTYSRNNFKEGCRPKGNGAWIVKNSYGETFEDKPLGDNGYMYISYEDASITELVAFDVEKATELYDNNYQYDGTGNPAYCYNKAPNGTSFANVFKTKAAAGYNEILKAVSVDVLSTNVSYKIEIYSGLEKASKPTSGKLVATQNGQFTNAGYNMIELTSPVVLAGGENYSVVVTLYSANGGSPCLACDTSYISSKEANDWIRFISYSEKNQSFVKLNGKWQDLGANASNARIKAFTDNTNEKTTYKLSNSSLGVSKSSSEKLSLNINPSSVKRKITWSSSNKKIATISSSGKIKGKAYGTTTIKAKFVAGGSTKTLSCKVTVGPSKIKNFKASGGKNRINVTWKKNSGVSGYAVYYSTERNGKYKSLATITSSSKTKCTKKKVSAGTYYVKMRPYIVKNGKKLFGSYTAVKEVQVN